MINRKIFPELLKWAKNKNRKPLVLRGARQVGKTTLINQFATQFEQYIYLNLELIEDRRPFDQFVNIDTLVQTLFFLKNKLLAKKDKTLIFIDEIQENPEALNILRYFYESEPSIAIVAAGSMLESLFDKNIRFPVGRVEYKVLRPISFLEFLDAMGEISAMELLNKYPIPAFAHDNLLRLFHIYVLIGGMPEIVYHYSQNKDLTALASIYDSLIAAYLDDVEKYAISQPQILHIRHVIKTSFGQAGKRIKFEGFGNSPYKSREMGDALRILEKALLLHLIYPETSGMLPFNPDIKKSPRLQLLDTGLLNYFVGVQREIINTKDLNSIYQGTIIEHIIGQELLANQYDSLSILHFWVREKKGSTAEIDYLYLYESQIIPIEVKAGSDGKLRSLNLFMDTVPHNMAIRFYSGELNISELVSAEGKPYFLFNLPYYLVSQLDAYLKYFSEKIKHLSNTC